MNDGRRIIKWLTIQRQNKKHGYDNISSIIFKGLAATYSHNLFRCTENSLLTHKQNLEYQ